jgi:hypothetical protein
MRRETLLGKVLPALIRGTGKEPLAGDSMDTLAWMSLAGMALRFERPVAPAGLMVEERVEDARVVLPEELRRAFVRVVNLKANSEYAGEAVAWEFDRLGMRPHPFDLPVVDRFVRQYAGRLGATAQRWARREETATVVGYFDEAALDDATWATASNAARVKYLRKRRAEDAVAGRALLEAVWSGEVAEARVKMLGTLEVGLGGEDVEFLKRVGQDRSPRVKAIAARLLNRLGEGDKDPAVEACLERIKRKNGRLELELPANVKRVDGQRWVMGMVEDVDLEALARALGVSVGEMIAGTEDELLLLGVALMATMEGRLDVVEQVVARVPELWRMVVAAGLMTLEPLGVAERERWFEVVMEPVGKDGKWAPEEWMPLVRLADVYVPEKVMRALLAQGLKGPEFENRYLMGPLLEMLVARCPVGMRGELKAVMAEMDGELTGEAMAVLAFLMEMEKEVTGE